MGRTAGQRALACRGETAEAALAARHDRALPAGLCAGGARDRLLAGGLGSLSLYRQGAESAWRRLRMARSVAARRAAEDDLTLCVAALAGIEDALREAILWPAP